jgi:hypothetical protein
MTTSPLSRSTPARGLALLYFFVAYVSLSLAFAAAAYGPRALGGFYYHARLIGVVHLVTLGWITAGIVGLIYLAVPVLLRTPLPARTGDYAAFAFFVLGLIGMVSHFWIEEFGGMAWSGLMAALGIAHVGGRVVPRVLKAAIPAGIKLPFVLAFANIALAATAGVVLGFDKVHHFLPGFVVSNVVAHAHLAALGWAAFAVIGLTYLVLPLTPVHRLDGRAIAVSVTLLEVATLGLAVSLLAGSRWAALFAALAAVVFVRFLSDVRRMRRERPPGTIVSPDVGGWHMVQAGAYLGATLAIGIALAWMPASERMLRLALAYGVCGLVGFLAQWVMGLQMRMIPLAFRAEASRIAPVPTFVMWSLSLPLLALGFYADSALLLTVAAAAACIATIGTGVQGAILIAPALSRGRLSWTRDRNERRRSAAHEYGVPQGRS